MSKLETLFTCFHLYILLQYFQFPNEQVITHSVAITLLYVNNEIKSTCFSSQLMLLEQIIKSYLTPTNELIYKNQS